jgi:hypothetical protein
MYMTAKFLFTIFLSRSSIFKFLFLQKKSLRTICNKDIYLCLNFCKNISCNRVRIIPTRHTWLIWQDRKIFCWEKLEGFSSLDIRSLFYGVFVNCLLLLIDFLILFCVILLFFHPLFSIYIVIISKCFMKGNNYIVCCIFFYYYLGIRINNSISLGIQLKKNWLIIE